MRNETKVLVIGALMLALTLGTLDSTIIATAMPRIVGKLGGINLYPWVFSIYLLTSTTAVPIYGKLADLYNRKPIIIAGIAVFLVGSLACGLAQSMEELIVFRAIQGLGAGAIVPLVLTIVSDISSSREERNRLQGFIGAIWGISSVVGPALGGIIVDNIGWQWVFFINLPLGLLAVTLLTLYLKESVQSQKHKLDYPGTLLLTGAVIALLLALLQGGTAWDWFSSQSIGLFIAAIILFAIFLLVERRSPEPIIPLYLFADRTIAVCSIGGFILGGLMYGLTSYVPLFVQGVTGSSATVAGLILIPQSLSWSIISMIIALILRRFGFRRIVRTGTLIAAIGIGMLTLFNPQTSIPYMLLVMILIGCGFGLASNVYTLSVQQAAPKNLIGVASASTQFVRMMGGTLGVAVMGALLNGQITQRFTTVLSRQTSTTSAISKSNISANILLTPELRATLPMDLLDQLKDALSQSLTIVYILMFILAIIAFGTALWFPRENSELEVEKEQSTTSPIGKTV